MTTLISKISVAKCHGKLDPKALPKNPILRVFGVARGVLSGTSTFGQWEALSGDFIAVNLETGEEFRSGKAFMPDIALNLVTGALAGSPDGVEFAFDFGVKPSTKDPENKYEYTVKPVVKAKESDQIANLRALVAEAAPALGHDGDGKKKK